MDKKVLGAVAVPVGVVGIIMMLVVPLPAPLLDVLIATNITASLVILLTAMFVKKPLDFSSFPAILLVATLFRLGLNVASTRLVLRDGFAGHVIDAFGHFVVGGSLVIGLVIFLILVVIQFAVITNGAGRVAEVGARFTLDAMPGKQMAIDADLNAGLINEDEARTRRAEVTAEADFYGAMDGGSKFVKGDAIAGIVITLINLIGGFVIGMVQHKMSAGESLNTYSLLTIGDGLVTQIPALLMSVATGLIVTRASSSQDMGSAASQQLGQSKIALYIAGSSVIALALIPGIPKLPFMLIGAAVLFVATRITAKEKAEAKAAATPDHVNPVATATETTEQLIQQMKVHPLEIALAPDLVELVGNNAEQDLLQRVRGLRRKIALELGVLVPPVRTFDSVELPASTYAIRISGVEYGRGLVPQGRLLALGDALDALPGNEVVEPVFGLPGKWIPAEMRHAAEMSGATVVDRVSVLITHLGSVIQANAGRLLGRDVVRELTEGVKLDNPSVVDELIPSLMTLGEVQRVLQGLLDERVPINDLSRIYEALTLRAKTSTETEALIEASRVALGPALTAQYAQDGVLGVVTLEPVFEQSLVEAVRPGERGSQLAIDPIRTQWILERLVEAHNADDTVVVVCSPLLRPALRRLAALAVPSMAVLSYDEVTGAGLQIDQRGVVTDGAAAYA